MQFHTHPILVPELSSGSHGCDPYNDLVLVYRNAIRANGMESKFNGGLVIRDGRD